MDYTMRFLQIFVTEDIFTVDKRKVANLQRLKKYLNFVKPYFSLRLVI